MKRDTERRTVLSLARLSSAAAFVALACLASRPWAQQGVQAGQATKFGDFQQAIYAASDGDVLYADHYTPRIKWDIIVDRPLVIVGGTFYGLAFTLQGPGYGTLTLVDVTVRDWAEIDPFGTPQARSAILGYGFDEVRILSSSIAASNPRGFDDEGRSAISLSVPSLVLVDTHAFASQGYSQFSSYTCSSVIGPGPAGIHCDMGSVGPPTTVTVIDSVIYGGAGIKYCFDESGACGSEPTNTDPGGPAVFTDRLILSSATLLGGAGCSWTNRPEVGSYGPPYIANQVLELAPPDHTR